MAETPNFDPELAYPSYDRPFLESWGGRFESVFVALHPFFRMPGLDPIKDGFFSTQYAESEAGKQAYERARIEKNLEAEHFLERGSGGGRLFASLGHPEGGWDQAQQVTWAEVAQQAELYSPHEVGKALLALIGALREPHPEQVLQLVRFCEQTRTFPPSEGEFQTMHYSSFLDLFKRAGSPVVMFQEEFEGQPALDLAYSEFDPMWPHRGSLFSADKSVLIVVDWDSYFTLIAGPRSLLDSWAKDRALEGFFADDTTTHHWWAEPTQLN